MLGELVRQRATIAVECNEDCLKAVEVKHKRKKLLLRRCARVSLSPGLLKGSLRQENLRDRKRLLIALQELLKKSEIKGKRVVLGIPDKSLFLDFSCIQDGKSKKEEIRKLLLWKYRELVPFNIEDAELDYQPLGTVIKDGNLQSMVFLCIVNKKVLSGYESLLNEAGMYVSGVGSASLGTFNLLHDALDGDTLVLNMSNRLTTVLASRNKGLNYCHKMEVGGTDFVSAMSKNKSEKADIEDYLRKNVFYPAEGKAKGTKKENDASFVNFSKIQGVNEKLLRGIEDSVRFMKREQPDFKLSKIYLAGYLSLMENTEGFIGQHFRVKVEKIGLKDCVEVSGVKGTVSPCFLPAIGLVS